jgi:predicted RNase H-like HicB family nuclease
MVNESVELTLRVREEGGMYWAEAVSHPGLFASGETIDQLVEAIGEAWALYSHDDSGPASPPAIVHPLTQSLQVLVPG